MLQKSEKGAIIALTEIFVPNNLFPGNNLFFRTQKALVSYTLSMV